MIQRRSARAVLKRQWTIWIVLLCNALRRSLCEPSMEQAKLPDSLQILTCDRDLNQSMEQVKLPDRLQNLTFGVVSTRSGERDLPVVCRVSHLDLSQSKSQWSDTASDLQSKTSKRCQSRFRQWDIPRTCRVSSRRLFGRCFRQRISQR